MAARPTVTVQSTEAEGAAGSTVAMPAVLLAPIRPDVVHDVHKDMAKNNHGCACISACRAEFSISSSVSRSGVTRKPVVCGIWL